MTPKMFFIFTDNSDVASAIDPWFYCNSNDSNFPTFQTIKSSEIFLHKAGMKNEDEVHKTSTSFYPARIQRARFIARSQKELF